MSLAFFAALTITPIVACSSEDMPPIEQSCIDVGVRCTTDDECCNENCMWQGDGAYCQNPRGNGSFCGRGGDGCTQNRHCCSNQCNDGVCAREPGDERPSQGCLPPGADCNVGRECCSGVCVWDAEVGGSICTT